MGSKDFNSFMDNYIDQVRSKKSSPTKMNLKRNDVIEEDVPEGVSSSSVYIIRKPKTWWQNLIQSFTSTEEEDFQEEAKQEKKVSVKEEQEFEQEYQEIVQEEERPGFLRKIFSIFSSNVNETYEDLDDEAKIERDVHEADIPDENLPVETEIVSQEKFSFGRRFLNFFGIGYEEVYDEEQSQEKQNIDIKDDPSMEKMIEIKEDMKQIAIIATAAFKKLPKEQFKLFKESADFIKFKSILKKHNIIKEK
jgi:hypothetical protein